MTSVDGGMAFSTEAFAAECDPITLLDACTITHVPNNTTKQTRLRLRPNPTTGQFTMEFQDPLVAKSYYSVFDPMGRLLFQRPLPTGATLEEVDLSRFGKGTYVIKVTDQNSVRVERVVLE